MNATQPVSCSVLISASASPFSPVVSAPSGYVRAPADARDVCRSIRTRPGSSSGGSVSGGQTTPVTPPARAACISTFSAPSLPGSISRAHRSTRPGATTRPFASIVRSGWKSFGRSPTAARRLSVMQTSLTRSSPEAGSITRPLVMTIFIASSTKKRRWTARPSAPRSRTSPAAGSRPKRRRPRASRSRPPGSSAPGASRSRPASRARASRA